MDRWSVGLKSLGTRQLTEDERQRIRGLQRRFRMRLGKVLLWCVLWAPVLPLMMRVPALDFGGWGVLAWFVAIMGAPIVAGPWAANGLSRAKKLGEDLHAGVVEILEPVHPAAGAESFLVEVLPGTGFVLNRRGKANEQWMRAPVRAVAEPVRSSWLDYFGDRSPTDRRMNRAITEAERDEIKDIRRRLLKPLGHAAFGFGAFTTIALVLGRLFVEELAHQISYGAALFLVLTFLLSMRRAGWLVWGLRGDLKTGTIVVVSFSESNRAQGAPETAEFLLSSHHLWSVNGAPAPWRIIAGTPPV